jgi:hypothetical protein
VTRTAHEGKKSKNPRASTVQKGGKAPKTTVTPSGSGSKMQAAVHKKARTELGKFTSEYSKDVKERTGRWALAFLSAESANNHSRWYTKLVQEFWDHNFKGLPRPTYNQVYYWMQSFNPRDSAAGAADPKQTRVKRNAMLLFPATQLSDVLGQYVLKLQFFAQGDMNRYVRILLLTSNQIGGQVRQSILFVRYLSNKTEETDEDCIDLRRRLEDAFAREHGQGSEGLTSKLTITCLPGNSSLARKFEGMPQHVKATLELHSRYFNEKLNCDQLELIGAGTFGNAFSLLKDGKKLGVVMKLYTEVIKRERAVAVAGNDAAAAAYEKILQKGKEVMRNTRIDLQPFAVNADIIGGPVGITFFPTDTGRGEFGMAALFMEEGIECAQPEVESLALRFRDPDGRVKREDWMQLASFMHCYLSSLQSMHFQGIANLDVKPANYVWVDACRKTGPIHYLGKSEHSPGRKVTGAFIDFGMGKFPKVKYLSDSDYKSATSPTDTHGDARQRSAGILTVTNGNSSRWFHRSGNKIIP